MADDLTFTAESVLKYLISNGGKVSNHDLVKHFKKFLSGPDSQHAKALFKEYVNSVATMKVEDGVKYVIAKKRAHNGKSDSSSSNSLSDSSNADAKKCKLSEDSVKSQAGILHSHSSPSILGMVPNSPDSPITPGLQQGVFWSSDLPPGHVPQPPPRRKHSLKGKENRGAKFEESIRQINEEKEVTASPTNEEIKDILSPGSVKEKADILNKMASEQEPLQKPSAPARRRDTHYKQSMFIEFGIPVSELRQICDQWENEALQPVLKKQKMNIDPNCDTPPSKKVRRDVSTIDRPSIPQPASSGIRSKDLMKSLNCPLCDNKFQQKRHLLRHMRWHENNVESSSRSSMEISEDEAQPVVRTVECQPEALQSSDNEVHPEMTTIKKRSELTGASTHGGDDDDTCSVSSMDPRRKEWIIKSARSDYHELVRLLREEPKLAHVKDHNKTALHWAAKHGKLDIIKLIAGTHKMDTNVKSGYTPLHMAAMFGHEEIMEILINTYGADPGLRDYSGKRAIHYLPKIQAERFLTLFPNLAYPILLCGKVVSGKKEKEHALMRMGSLNSKTKRTSVLSAGRALTRMKSWGSADNIPDRAVNLMPPPKTYPKKKKSRKYGDVIGFSDNWRAKSGDSDSDSASGIAS